MYQESLMAYSQPWKVAVALIKMNILPFPFHSSLLGLDDFQKGPFPYGSTISLCCRWS